MNEMVAALQEMTDYENMKNEYKMTIPLVSRQAVGGSTSKILTISSDFFAELVFKLLSDQEAPPETAILLAEAATLGNRNALLCLPDSRITYNLPPSVISMIENRLCELSTWGDDYKFYSRGLRLVVSEDNRNREQGISFLRQAGAAGFVAGYWHLALYYISHNPNEAIRFARLSATCGHRVATLAMEFADTLLRISRIENSDEHKCAMHHLKKDKEALQRQFDILLAQSQTERQELTAKIAHLNSKNSELEDTLRNQTLGSLCDRTVAESLIKIRKLEDELLESQCLVDEANSARAKAEGTADNLKGHNRYLSNLLAENGIPFVRRPV